eukprot:ANDGO_00294.mRNA.1 putative ethanolamine kinase A
MTIHDIPMHDDEGASLRLRQTVLEACMNLVPALHQSTNDVPVDLVHVKGGITNRLFKCTVGSTSVLCRVYGQNTEKLIDRNYELLLIQTLAARSLGPHFYGKFSGGYVYEYIPGRSLLPEELPAFAHRVATYLAKFHVLDMPGDKRRASLMGTLRKWMETARSIKPEFFEKFNLDRELDILEAQLHGEIVFCHNDLLPGNILARELCGNDESEQVAFIDYEYASYNYAEFDIGNHFAEFCGWEQNLEKDFPSEEVQRLFIGQYLRTRGMWSQENEDLWRKRVLKFSLAAHLYWSLWALVQSSFSSIDFDFASYAEHRTKNYFAYKDRLLE